MHPDTREVALHMRQFGLAVLGRALHDATFAEIGAPFVHALAVVHAAHGAEVVIKARIAEEHPLLILERLPGQKSTPGTLTLQELFLHGRSHDYGALPQILWAATGHRVPDLSQYEAFGRLRNRIVHFAVPNGDLSGETIRYCLQVVEPMLYDFWDVSCMEHADDWDEVTVSEGYFAGRVASLELDLDERVRDRLRLLTVYPKDAD